MIRTHDAGALTQPAHVGQTVTLAGWVANRRDHGGVAFIDLRDASGVVQVVIRDEEVAHSLRAEFCLKVTGEVVWRRHLGNYSWSSPTLVTSTDGRLYGVLADSDGVMHLFDPETGEDISTVSLGKNVEATPSVFGDMLVVASYDRNIYGIRIR